MSHCDITLPSLDDSVHLTGFSDPDRIVDFYLDLGASIVVLKMGAQGCLVATVEDRRPVATYPVDAVDATGAGDAFDGAFYAEYLRHRDPLAAATHAVVVAAITTTGYGAMNAIPDRHQIMRLIRS